MGPVPWFFAGAWFVWFTAFLWGLTVDPTKAAKWALVLGPRSSSLLASEEACSGGPSPRDAPVARSVGKLRRAMCKP